MAMVITFRDYSLFWLLLWLLLCPRLWAAESLRIATFNVAWLADEPLSDGMLQRCQAEARAFPRMELRPTPVCRNGLLRTQADYAELARQVARLDADIIAFEEVQSERALAWILADGTYQAPGAWRWWVNPLPVNAKQRVAIAVRSSRLRALQLQPLPELGQPLWREQRGGLLARLTLATGRQLHLLVVHLKSGCRDGILEGAKACRQLAAQGEILARIIDEEQQTGAPLVILGDFNRDFAHEQGLWSLLDNQQPRGTRLHRLTLGFSLPPGCYPPRYGPDPIDHIVLSTPFSGQVERIWAQPLAPSLRHARRVLSDHCPLGVELSWREGYE